MTHCLACLHKGYLINAYGVETPCPSCPVVFVKINADPERGIRAAIAAVEVFVRDLGINRKAVS